MLKKYFWDKVGLREGRQTAFAKAIPEPCKQLRYQILTGWLHLEEKTFSVEVFQYEEEDEGIGGGDEQRIPVTHILLETIEQ